MASKVFDALSLALGVGVVTVLGFGELVLVFPVFGPWAIRILLGIGFLARLAVHGRYRKPCPRCGAPIQHIVRRERNELLCALQTRGKILADRSLSRPLNEDWPRTLEAWEDSLLAGGDGGKGR